MSNKKLYKVTVEVELIWYGEQVDDRNLDLIEAIEDAVDDEFAVVYWNEITKINELNPEFLVGYYPYGDCNVLQSVKEILEKTGEENAELEN